MEPKAASISFASLLAEALTVPGRLSEAYRAFHSYSIGNAWAAASQCLARGIPIGPIASFQAWKAKGRHVRKGERALMLCMPITYARKHDGSDERDLTDMRTFFVWRPNWFVLSQTEGQDMEQAAPIGDWSVDRAVSALGLTQEAFAWPDGNVQGYARPGGIVSVSPLAYNPVRTLIHECAHQVLGHLDSDTLTDTERPAAFERETEAEGAAYVVLASLGLDASGLAESRGYLQAWNAGRGVSERSAARIFKAADRILKAGRADTIEVTLKASDAAESMVAA